MVRSALFSLLLVGASGCAGNGCAAPAPATAQGSAVADVAVDDIAALAARPESVIDARTRPEPHPVIPVGNQLTAYIGPRFITGEDFVPEARVVVADEGGRVRALLREVPSPNPYKTVTLPGALAVAGLHDAHLDLEGIGRAGEGVDVSGAKKPAEIATAVRAFVKTHAGLAVVRGRGWDPSRFPGQRPPTHADVDGATDTPLLLTRVDGHAVLVNAALLKAANITKDTPDPAGGQIVRGKDGAPTGVLVDNAIDIVTKQLPRPTPTDHERWLIAGMKACADAGLVAVHDMGMDKDAVRVLKQLDDKGALPVRVFVYVDGGDDDAWALLGAFTATDMLQVMGVDLGRPTDHRLLEQRIARAHDLRFQVAVQAHGERTDDAVIDLLAKHHRIDIRDRLEHAQGLAVDDIVRLYEPRITASMRPTHATNDGGSAWRSFFDAGVALTFGSDAPLADVHPQFGVHAAITRTDVDGQPSQRLTQQQALRTLARNAAWAVNLERHAGALTPGMYFDVSLFESDVAAAVDAGDAAAWAEARAVGTVVSGRLRPVAGVAPVSP